MRTNSIIRLNIIVTDRIPQTFYILIFLVLLSSTLLFAQEGSEQHAKPLRNSIGAYVGLLDVNLNYERNVIQRPKSYSNVRLGFGRWTDLASGGKYINASFIHLLGKKKSHVEFNLGIRLTQNSNVSGSSSTFLLPDIYVGYRYEYVEVDYNEKSKGNSYFRVGFSSPTFINVGGGIKF